MTTRPQDYWTTGLRGLACRVALAWAVGVMVCGPALGADIISGHSWVDGDRVTATDLNSAVGSATIGSAFYTAKTPVASPNAADLVMLYSSSLTGLRTISVANLVYSNADLIGTLFYAPNAVNRSNFLAGVDLTTASNFLSLQLSGTLTNAPLATVTNGTTNLVATITLTNPAVQAVRWPMFFTVTNIPLNNGTTTNVAHGLPGTPQVRWVLRCTANDGFGRNVGDEIPVEHVMLYQTNTVAASTVPVAYQAFTVGANSSNVWASMANGGLASQFQQWVTWGTNGIAASLSTNKWRLKCTAIFWP